MAPRIIEEHRKEVNIAVILVLFIILGSYANILPFDVTGTVPAINKAFIPQYVTMTCEPASTADPGQSLILGRSGDAYLGRVKCMGVGGCKVVVTVAKATPICADTLNSLASSQQSCACSGVNTGPGVSTCTCTYPYSANIDFSFRVISTFPPCSATVQAFISYYPLYDLWMTGYGNGLGKVELKSTKNCIFNSEDPAVLQAYSTAIKNGSLITAGYQFRCQPGGACETKNFVSMWTGTDTYNFVNSLGVPYSLNGQSINVICKPATALYKADVVQTVSGPYFKQGDLLETAGTSLSGSICCGQGECGATGNCWNYHCVNSNTPNTCDQCPVGATDEEVSGSCHQTGTNTFEATVTTCAPQLGKSYGCRTSAKKSVKCCDDTCPVNTYCQPDQGCLDLGVVRECPPGSCCNVNGTTPGGQKITGLTQAQSHLTTQYCQQGTVCCFGNAAEPYGTCTAQCTGSTPTVTTQETQSVCTYAGFLGWWAQSIGMGCDTFGMIAAIIILVILIAILLVIVSWILKARPQ